jgi:hypothetical protein
MSKDRLTIKQMQARYPGRFGKNKWNDLAKRCDWAAKAGGTYLCDPEEFERWLDMGGDKCLDSIKAEPASGTPTSVTSVVAAARFTPKASASQNRLSISSNWRAVSPD